MESATDEVLMLRVAEFDDGRALSELYDRYGSLVYGVGMRHLGGRTLADDLVQDVFVSVRRNAASFDPSRGGFSAWVYHITRNLVTKLARRRERLRAVVSISGEKAYPEIEEDDTEETLRTFDMVGALSKISPAHREVLTLAYLEGLSQPEISHRTGMPLDMVRSRTTAALRAIRGQTLAAKAPNEAREGAPKDRWSKNG